MILKIYCTYWQKKKKQKEKAARSNGGKKIKCNTLDSMGTLLVSYQLKAFSQTVIYFRTEAQGDESQIISVS